MSYEEKIKALIEISVQTNRAAICYQLQLPDEGKEAEDKAFGLLYELREKESGRCVDYTDIAEYF